MANERTKTVYTTAPACYDYGWTTEIEANAGCHKYDARMVYRRVEIQEGMAKGQCMRYQSGGYVALDCRQFAQWIDDGLVLFGDAARAVS
jgi:2-polyprenyl-6-methoxyphenol hydroxylase-like FAD-dependent oxidoreductase